MLKRLGGTVDPKGAATAIKDAEFPVPFASELEYCSHRHAGAGCSSDLCLCR